MSTKKPWEIEPLLTEQRLRLLAREAVRTRREALRTFSPEEGETAWSLGCRAYERLVKAYMDLQLSGHYPWLVTRKAGLYFALFIEEDGNRVPVRFYRGEPENPSTRVLRSGPYLLKETWEQMKLALPDVTSDNQGWFWLLAIDLVPLLFDSTGRYEDGGTVARVILHQARDTGDTRNEYVIPLDDLSETEPSGGMTQQEPPDLGPPLIEGLPDSEQHDRESGVDNT